MNSMKTLGNFLPILDWGVQDEATKFDALTAASILSNRADKDGIGGTA